MEQGKLDYFRLNDTLAYFDFSYLNFSLYLKILQILL